MAAKSFLRLIGGVLSQVTGVQTSAGAGNAGDIVALDETGRIDTTMMPVGIGADTKSLPATESLSAGDYVNIYNASGTPSIRKADATTAGKEVDGYVLAGVTSGQNGLVYKEGSNTQLTGLTGGQDLYLSTTPGQVTATPPSAAGNVVQRVGKALSATEADFERGVPVTLVNV